MPAARPADVSSRLVKVCLALPEASHRPCGDHIAFEVRKKVFAYFLNDHHGDGIVSVACKALPGDNAALAAAQPERFYLPPYVGPRGWVGLRLDRGSVDWDEVAEVVACSYRLVAPKKLAAALGATLPAAPESDPRGSPAAPAKSSRSKRPPAARKSPARR